MTVGVARFSPLSGIPVETAKNYVNSMSKTSDSGRKVTSVGVAPQDGGKDWTWLKERGAYVQ